MLDSLDTLIAFVLIMLVVSLVITIAVQMTSAALNLRGLNLLNGLSNAFAAIAPDLEQNTKDLARLILKGPLLSDSSCRIGQLFAGGGTLRLSDLTKLSIPFTESRPAGDPQIRLCKRPLGRFSLH